MCGFVGIADFKNDISNKKEILLNMNSTLSKRGPDEDGFYINSHIALAHKRLNVIDPDGGKQPMIVQYNNSIPLSKEKSNIVISYQSNFIISYNGQIYNTKELRKTLEENGFTFDGHCDTEILLKSYIYYGINVVKHLNGIYAFAIWDSQKEELFMARDHFGVKPLFYTMQSNSFIFASEIKAIFQYPGVEKILDSQGISELFGIGPAHTPGTTIFNNISKHELVNYERGRSKDRGEVYSLAYAAYYNINYFCSKEIMVDNVARELEDLKNIDIITFDIIILQAFVYYAQQNDSSNSKGLKSIYKKYCADVIKRHGLPSTLSEYIKASQEYL